MKVLFSAHPGSGHLRQAFRLGKALQEAGHEVAMATANSYKNKIEERGFQHFAAGLEWDSGKIEETIPEIRSMPPEAQTNWIMENIFFDRSPRRMIPNLLEIAQSWSPNVMVVDNFEFGGVIAAQMLNLPCVRYHRAYYLSPFLLKEWQLSHPINQLRTLFNLPPDPECLSYHRCLDLCFMPKNWSLPWLGGDEIPSSAHFIDPLEGGLETSPPAWLKQLPSQPTIYMSLGTVFNEMYPNIFVNAITALREEPFNLIITLGNKGADSSRFGPLPKNIRVESFIAHSEVLGLLPHVDLFISHGGPNSVMEALSFGVPLLLLPLVGDQPIVAEICIAREAAIPLPPPALHHAEGMAFVNPPHLTPELIRQVVRQAMGNPTYRSAAKQLQMDLRALPKIEAAVGLLEQLVATPKR